jgi:DNA-binding IclR family transcriptional regulator
MTSWRPHMASEQRGIGSVEVGGQLLRVLTESEGPMMLRDLAAAAGMTAPKAHPYLVSFVRLGLVEQDKASGRYELGALALQMGLACMRRLNPVRIATDAVSELVETINQTVALAVWGNHGPTIVRIEEGADAVHVNMRVGSIMSLLGTATGRVFAAFQPTKMIETFISSGVGKSSVGDASVGRLSHQQLKKIVSEIKQRGFERTIESPIPGVSAFSAPVFDHSGSIALVITAIGPAGTFDTSWESSIAEELCKCATTVSTRLGFPTMVSRVA